MSMHPAGAGASDGFTISCGKVGIYSRCCRENEHKRTHLNAHIPVTI